MDEKRMKKAKVYDWVIEKLFSFSKYIYITFIIHRISQSQSPSLEAAQSQSQPPACRITHRLVQMFVPSSSDVVRYEFQSILQILVLRLPLIPFTLLFVQINNERKV